MDNSPSLLVWILVISGVTTGALIAVLAIVFGWHQRRIAAEAEQWGRHLLAAQDEERYHLAQELHDDMVPRVFAARLAVDRDAKFDASEQLGEIAQSLRTLAHDLHPPALEFLELSRVLRELVARHQHPGGPSVTFEGAGEVSLPASASVATYRVAQEALNNALKHASAQAIQLTIETLDNHMILTVSDDGHGIPSDKLNAGSFGLRSMRERLKSVGGTLELAQDQPKGTRLVARVPVP